MPPRIDIRSIPPIFMLNPCCAISGLVIGSATSDQCWNDLARANANTVPLSIPPTVPVVSTAERNRVGREAPNQKMLPATGLCHRGEPVANTEGPILAIASAKSGREQNALFTMRSWKLDDCGENAASSLRVGIPYPAEADEARA